VHILFKGASSSDPYELIFVDRNGKEYSLYTDDRSKSVGGLTPGFWDSFYTSKKINIDYIEKESKRIVSKIYSY